MSISAIHPAVDGVCPRCGSAGQAEAIFCTVCSLRLAAGMFGFQGRAAVASAVWMQMNPELADVWRMRLEEDEAGVAFGRHLVTGQVRRLRPLPCRSTRARRRPA